MTTTTTFTPTTAVVQAQRLRDLADVLEACGLEGLSVFVSMQPAVNLREQAARVAVVDELASQLGLTAEPTASSGLWSHKASSDTDRVHVQVSTFIDEPARRCACGARCTHTEMGGPQ